MPQPPLPAPLASRPDPGAQLLEAVRSRQAQRSLQLAQQWVHRRGVSDLQRFCGTVLAGAQGSEAVAWLEELLTLERPLPAGDAAAPVSTSSLQTAWSSPAPQAPDIKAVSAAETAVLLVGGPDSPADQAPVTPAPSAPSAEPAAEPSPWSAAGAAAVQTDLESRAVAAVDEAFAALEQSFQQEPRTGALPTPQPSAVESPPDATGTPQPLPVRSGLWPSLLASTAGLGTALRPPTGSPVDERPDIDATAGPAPLSEEQTTTGDRMHLGTETADPQPLAPAALPEPLASRAVPMEAGSDAAAEPDVSAQASDASTETPAEHADGAETRIGLMQRLRGRMPARPLSRLRGVVRDCVEETVAMLRTPEPERAPVDGGLELSPPPEPAQPERDTPAFAWSLDPFLAPPTMPTPEAASAPPTPAVQATPAPAAASEHGEPVSTEPTPGFRLRFGLPVTKPANSGERPAPAPDSLSDLRAWLPDRGDLPRAS